MAKLSNVRLSSNPDAVAVEFQQGLKGQVNQTQNGNKFVILELSDDSNLLKAKRAVRLYWFNETSGKWPGATPDVLKANIGAEIPGKFITHKVAPYAIGDSTMTTYTTFIMEGENDLTVFSNAGHTVLDNETNEVLIHAKVRGTGSMEGMKS